MLFTLKSLIMGFKDKYTAHATVYIGGALKDKFYEQTN